MACVSNASMKEVFYLCCYVPYQSHPYSTLYNLSKDFVTQVLLVNACSYCMHQKLDLKLKYHKTPNRGPFRASPPPLHGTSPEALVLPLQELLRITNHLFILQF